MLFFLQFLALGLGVGLLGTLVGAGGGFILTPVLLLLFPDRPSEIIAATSFGAICLNALSGSLAYYRMRRIDLKTSLSFALAGAPWVIVGVYATSEVVRGPFDVLLGLFLLALCVSIINPPPPLKKSRAGARGLGALARRRIVDRTGRVYEYAFRFRLGVLLSSFTGFLASFLAIGGGAIHVPVMIRVLRIPPHVATATSQGVLLCTSFLALTVHFLNGNLRTMTGVVLPLALGTIAGAQPGAAYSNRVKSATLARVLAALFSIVSLQLLYKGALAWMR